VYLYTRTTEEAPSFKNVGDIILLKNFMFELNEHNDTSYILGKYHKGCSEWMVFDGRENSQMLSIAKSKQVTTKVFDEEQAHIKMLRAWGKGLFKESRLKDLAWFTSEFPDKIIQDSVYQLKDIDMIVKLIAKVKAHVNGAVYFKFAFADEQKKIYYAELQRQDADLELGQVYKLRSVCLIMHNNCHKINFFNYSSILYLHSFFKDAVILNSAVGEMIVSQEDLEQKFFRELHLEKCQRESVGSHAFFFTTMLSKNAKKRRAEFIQNFPVLQGYDLSQVNIQQKGCKSDKVVGSVIKINYKDLPYTTLENIQEILEECKSNPDAFDVFKNQYYRVKGNIDWIESTDLEDICRFVSPSKNQIWELKQKDIA
jgi:hypothetical protein